MEHLIHYNLFQTYHAENESWDNSGASSPTDCTVFDLATDRLKEYMRESVIIIKIKAEMKKHGIFTTSECDKTLQCLKSSI